MDLSFPLSRRACIVISAWFVLLLLTPLIAFTAGNRSENVDQRRFQAWPGLQVDRGLDSRYYRSMDRFLTDRSPIRDEAIQAKGEVTNQFSTVVNGVINGQDGWRFLVEELTPACYPQYSTEQRVAAIQSVHQQLNERGVESLFVISPDKFTIMGDKLPARTKDLGCARAAHQLFRQSLSYGPRGEAVDLWDVLERQRNDSPNPVFWKNDSHLTAEGRTAVVRSVVDRLSPGLFDDKSVVEVTDVNDYSDLARLQGIMTTERVKAHAIKRPDVELKKTTVIQAPGAVESVTSYVSSGPGRVIPGNTVVINDSQFGPESGRQEQLAPWFERSTFIHWDLLETPQAVAALGKADRLVVESVERYSWKIVAYLAKAIAAASPGS